MNKLLIILVALIALAAGALLRVRDLADMPATPVQLDFNFPDVTGQPQSVKQWQGKILVINFWATWCPPCLQEIPEFVRWQQEFKADGVQFIGIALDEQNAVAEYLQKVQINYPILIAGDAGAMLAQQWGNIINAVPFTVIVDAQGRIVHRQPGEMDRQQFLQVLQPLLAKQGQIDGKSLEKSGLSGQKPTN